MKINLSNDPVSASITAVGAGKVDRHALASLQGTKPAARSSDSGVPVSVSTSARALDVVSAGSGVDEAKVAAMRAAIADGTFKVDAGAIADKLLANAQEFLTRAGS